MEMIEDTKYLDLRDDVSCWGLQHVCFNDDGTCDSSVETLA